MGVGVRAQLPHAGRRTGRAAPPTTAASRRRGRRGRGRRSRWRRRAGAGQPVAAQDRGRHLGQVAGAVVEGDDDRVVARRHRRPAAWAGPTDRGRGRAWSTRPDAASIAICSSNSATGRSTSIGLRRPDPVVDQHDDAPGRTPHAVGQLGRVTSRPGAGPTRLATGGGRRRRPSAQTVPGDLAQQPLPGRGHHVEAEAGHDTARGARAPHAPHVARPPIEHARPTRRPSPRAIARRPARPSRRRRPPRPRRPRPGHHGQAGQPGLDGHGRDALGAAGQRPARRPPPAGGRARRSAPTTCTRPGATCRPGPSQRARRPAGRRPPRPAARRPPRHGVDGQGGSFSDRQRAQVGDQRLGRARGRWPSDRRQRCARACGPSRRAASALKASAGTPGGDHLDARSAAGRRGEQGSAAPGHSATTRRGPPRASRTRTRRAGWWPSNAGSPMLRYTNGVRAAVQAAAPNGQRGRPVARPRPIGATGPGVQPDQRRRIAPPPAQRSAGPSRQAAACPGQSATRVDRPTPRPTAPRPSWVAATSAPRRSVLVTTCSTSPRPA